MLMELHFARGKTVKVLTSSSSWVWRTQLLGLLGPICPSLIIFRLKGATLTKSYIA